MKKKPERKRLSGGERKDQIVRVATVLFAKNGFRGTTTREIARKAGISEAVIYRYFKRKEDLYKAIIDARCDGASGESRLLTALRGKRGKEVFREVGSFIVNEHQADPSLLRLLNFSALEKQNLSEIFIKTRALELIGFLESQIRVLQKDGTFREADPTVAARAFLGMVLQYSISQELYGLRKYFNVSNDYVIDAFVDIFFEGMLRR